MNRERFPGLSDSVARFDGPAGSQLVDTAAAAIGAYVHSPVANAHGGFPPSDRTDAIVAGARGAIAELFGAAPERIVLGASMTQLSYALAAAAGADVAAGDELLCTRLDHEANVSPWRQLAASRGAHLRIADPDPETLDLSVAHVERALTGRTRWVAVTAASNAAGAAPDIPAIVALAHAASARVVVDAVHAAPHMAIDFDGWGADALLVSAYKWFGPHGSALLLSPELIEQLDPQRLREAPAAGVERWERGALAFEQLPGIEAAARYVLETGIAPIAAHEAQLHARLAGGLRALPGVTVYGDPPRRTSTVLFNVDGLAPHEVAAALREHDVYVWHGHFYALELMDFLGIEGAVRAGLLHYNTAQEVDRLLELVAALAARRTPSPVSLTGGD